MGLSVTWHQLVHAFCWRLQRKTHFFAFWTFQGPPAFHRSCCLSPSSAYFISHWCVCVCVCARAHSVAQSYLTLWHPVDCSPPGSTVHEISQARILEWVAIFSSRGSSRDGTCASCVAGRLFRTSVTLRSSLSLTTPRRDSQHLKEIMRTSAHLENAG